MLILVIINTLILDIINMAIYQKSFNKQLGTCNGNHETFIFLLFIKKDECLKNADRHDESNIQDTKYVQLLYINRFCS